MKCYIYTLTDPNTNQVRYVGKAKNPKDRYSNHINKSRDKNTHKRNWINKLRKTNQKPLLEIIEETTDDNWKEREKHWIKYYLNSGNKLVNYTEGGDGLTFGNKTSFKKGDGNRKVVALNKNGIIFKIFESRTKGSLYFGLNGGGLGGTLEKSRKTWKGYLWLYYDDYHIMTSNDILNHVKWALSYDMKPNKTSFKKGHDLNSKKVYQYSLNFKFIKKWKSCADAGRKLKLNNIAIGNCARGTTKSSGGYIWKY